MKIGKIFVLVAILSFAIALAYGFYTRTNAAPAVPPSTASRIVVNQVGYSPTRSKSAVLINLENLPESNKVALVNFRNKRTVFETNLGERYEDEASKDVIQAIDFTPFNKEGRYYLKSGTIESYPFRIGKDIYQDAFTKLLRSYYSGSRLSPTHSGKI